MPMQATRVVDGSTSCKDDEAVTVAPDNSETAGDDKNTLTPRSRVARETEDGTAGNPPRG